MGTWHRDGQKKKKLAQTVSFVCLFTPFWNKREKPELACFLLMSCWSCCFLPDPCCLMHCFCFRHAATRQDLIASAASELHTGFYGQMPRFLRSNAPPVVHGSDMNSLVFSPWPIISPTIKCPTGRACFESSAPNAERNYQNALKWEKRDFSVVSWVKKKRTSSTIQRVAYRASPQLSLVPIIMPLHAWVDSCRNTFVKKIPQQRMDNQCHIAANKGEYLFIYLTSLLTTRTSFQLKSPEAQCQIQCQVIANFYRPL